MPSCSGNGVFHDMMDVDDGINILNCEKSHMTDMADLQLWLTMPSTVCTNYDVTCNCKIRDDGALCCVHEIYINNSIVIVT